MLHSSPLRAGLIGVTLTVSTIIAAAAAPSQPAPSADAASDEAALCASLADEWKTAEAACSSNANLGRARSLAREAETKCKANEPQQHKLGVNKYQSALRLCRKPSTTP